MTANPNAGWEYHGSSGNDFQKFGNPGKYQESKLITGTQIAHFTGSDYGYGAVMISGSYSGNIELSNGGTVSGNALAAGELVELSVYKISGGAGTEAIYAFKRQTGF